MRVLIVGCGYVGLPLGVELVRQRHRVFGLRRSRVAAPELERAGIEPLCGDIARPADLESLPLPFDWVVNTAASSGGGREDYRQVYFQGTQNLLRRFRAGPPRKYVYTSSTGVYGQNDGSTVDESSPTVPDSETGQVLADTERLLLEAAREHRFPAVILRVAGIYGPGRGYYLRQFLSGEARMEGAGERMVNMIHRDDLVGIIITALEQGRPGQVYNAVDDEPVSQAALYHWLSQTLGRQMPPSLEAGSQGAGRRGPTNKAVSNRRLRSELGHPFKYPTFREGYAAELRRLNPRNPGETTSGGT